MRRERECCTHCGGGGILYVEASDLEGNRIDAYEICPGCGGDGEFVREYPDPDPLLEMVNEPVGVSRKSFLEWLFGL